MATISVRPIRDRAILSDESLHKKHENVDGDNPCNIDHKRFSELFHREFTHDSIHCHDYTSVQAPVQHHFIESRRSVRNLNALLDQGNSLGFDPIQIRSTSFSFSLNHFNRKKPNNAHAQQPRDGEHKLSRGDTHIHISESNLGPTLEQRHHRLTKQLSLHPKISVASMNKNQIKRAVRSGFDDEQRAEIWIHVTNSSGYMLNNSRVLHHSMQMTFGDNVPPVLRHVPTFGTTEPLDVAAHIPLSKNGLRRVDRVLCVLAKHNPDITFCPTLPVLFPLLLLIMPLNDAYCVAHVMLTTSKQTRWYFDTTSLTSSLFIRVFVALVENKFPVIFQHMGLLGFHVATLAQRWFHHLFVSHFPLPVVVRIMDCFMLEGYKVLYRIGLAVLKIHSQAILQCRSASQLEETLQHACSSTEDVGVLLEAAFSFNLSRSQFQRFEVKYRSTIDNAVRRGSASAASLFAAHTNLIYLRPKMHGLSHIIDSEQCCLIWYWLPAAFRVADAHLVYSSQHHGSSLATMLRKIALHQPKPKQSILLVKDMRGCVFGCFAADQWKMDDVFYGSSDSFLFSLVPEAHVYHAAKHDESAYYQLVDGEFLVMGGGGDGYGLSLNKAFNQGTTGTCDAFNNPPLNGIPGAFICDVIELWGIY